MALQLLISGLLLGGLYAVVALGVTLVFGVMRIVNFAHGEFLMIGMYFTYFLAERGHINPYLAVLLVAPAVLLLAILAERVIIRYAVGGSALVQTFVTLGLSVVLQNLALTLWTADYRSLDHFKAPPAVHFGALDLSMTRLIAAGVGLIISIALWIFIRYSYVGKAMRAITMDRRAAQLMGVNVDRIYLWTFAIGTALAGVAGTLLMPIFYAYPTVGAEFSLVAFVIVVLGGMGSIPGAIGGAVIIGLVETIGSYLVGASWNQAIYFVAFLLVLILRPSGLFGQKGAEELGAK